MTDMEWIAEQIQLAMQALDKAHEAGENLRNNVTEENVDAFREQVLELADRLSTMKNILEHESHYSLDELVDAFTILTSGKPAAYRSSHRFG